MIREGKRDRASIAGQKRGWVWTSTTGTEEKRREKSKEQASWERGWKSGRGGKGRRGGVG